MVVAIFWLSAVYSQQEVHLQSLFTQIHTMKSEINHLVHKYNTSGPRYTSYPTALLLKPVNKLDQFYRELGMVSDTGKELSLYVHLPFCRSLCWYCGCNKVITRASRDADQYLEYLEKDFALTSPHLPTG